jgi:hypothetical protein
MGAFMRMTDSAGKESGDSTRGSRARRSHAQDGARAGDDQRFDEQLAHDAPAAGADRRADREFMPARAAPGQQKNGAVGAADDEQKDDTGQQKRERTP